MITLVCTKCSTLLKVDDGFAGGVCRCSTCGTIQTVPKKGEAQAKSTDAGTVIYERKTREAVSKDLEALGEVVTSSGIVGSGMLQQAMRPAQPVSASNAKWFGIALASIIAIGGAWFFLTRSSEPTSPGAVMPAKVDAQQVVTNGARFGTIPLDRAGTIVYLVDRGDATRPFAAPLQSAVLKSVATLDAARRFQIRYWSAAGESPAFPLTPSEPSDYNQKKAATWMNDIVGGQSTDAMDSLDAALAQKPTEIVLITGKAWQMDDSFTNEAVVKLAGRDVRIHVVSLGSGTADDPLARLASKTGGRYLALTSGELARLAD